MTKNIHTMAIAGKCRIDQQQQKVMRQGEVFRKSGRSTGKKSLANKFRSGDRISIHNSTCSSARRTEIILDDITAIVTRVKNSYIHFTCNSGIQTKRYSANTTLINSSKNS